MSRGFDRLFGVWIIVLGVASLAWLGFMGWLLYSVAEWGMHH